MKQERSAATIEKVLTAALKCFIAGDDSIHAIAKASKTSIGSLYHHFGSRERIVLALYQRCLGQLLEAITDAVRPQPTAREGVEAAVRAYLDFVEQHPRESKLIFAAAHLGLARDFRPELVAHAEQIGGELRAWFGSHIVAGRLAPLPAPLFEVVLIGQAAEASRRLLSGAAGLTYDEARETLAVTAWAALQPQPVSGKSRR